MYMKFQGGIYFAQKFCCNAGVISRVDKLGVRDLYTFIAPWNKSNSRWELQRRLVFYLR